MDDIFVPTSQGASISDLSSASDLEKFPDSSSDAEPGRLNIRIALLLAVFLFMNRRYNPPGQASFKRLGNSCRLIKPC
jgi:hypothetical protein